MYSYDMYVINPYYRENLQTDIDTNYQIWLEMAKKQEFDKLAQEIRAKRDELLIETDKEMVLDRLQLNMPEDITMTNIVSGIKEFFTSLKEIFTSDMAKYRQSLRDIPQQPGFPYDVVWPEKPKTKEESDE